MITCEEGLYSTVQKHLQWTGHLTSDLESWKLNTVSLKLLIYINTSENPPFRSIKTVYRYLCFLVVIETQLLKNIVAVKGKNYFQITEKKIHNDRCWKSASHGQIYNDAHYSPQSTSRKCIWRFSWLAPDKPLVRWWGDILAPTVKDSFDHLIKQKKKKRVIFCFPPGRWRNGTFCGHDRCVHREKKNGSNNHNCLSGVETYNG